MSSPSSPQLMVLSRQLVTKARPPSGVYEGCRRLLLADSVSRLPPIEVWGDTAEGGQSNFRHFMVRAVPSRLVSLGGVSSSLGRVMVVVGPVWCSEAAWTTLS